MYVLLSVAELTLYHPNTPFWYKKSTNGFADISGRATSTLGGFGFGIVKVAGTTVGTLSGANVGESILIFGAVITVL